MLASKTVLTCALRAGLGLSLALLTACNATSLRKPTPPNRTELLGVSYLGEMQPADIALAPVRNQTEVEELPLAQVRQAFYAGLVQRLYSPLDLAYVDGHWAESSFRGAPAPDALLVVAITDWDTRNLGHGFLKVAAELRLFEGGTPAGRALWGVAIERKLVLARGDGPHGPPEKLIAKAAEMLAEEALAQLPERDPLAVQR